MTEKRFHREEYPLDILAEFGLTENMIYDLPNFVHETIEMGGKSPLLPIIIEQPYGHTKAYAKFCIIETDEGLDVLFSPKLISADLSMFSDKEQSLLLEGKVIVADIEDTVITEEGVEDIQNIKAFVQLDKDTNGVVYCPTPVIARNLTAICSEYDIDGDSLKSLMEGNLVTIQEENEDGDMDNVTIGIDLMCDKGALVVAGDSSTFQYTVRHPIPKYNFGNDGCWVNHGGVLDYVPEEYFTKEMYDEIALRTKRNSIVPPSESEGYANGMETERSGEEENLDDNRQMGR